MIIDLIISNLDIITGVAATTLAATVASIAVARKQTSLRLAKQSNKQALLPGEKLVDEKPVDQKPIITHDQGHKILMSVFDESGREHSKEFIQVLNIYGFEVALFDAETKEQIKVGDRPLVSVVSTEK